MLQAGFARMDVTPPLGVSLKGYYRIRICDGVLDPLEINAVAFEEDGKKAVLLSIDNVGIKQTVCDEIRDKIAAATGCAREGIYLACTHTHLGPGVGTIMGLGGSVTPQDDEYGPWFIQRAVDTAVMAMDDLAPVTSARYTHANVPDVSFVRRYQMKDGSIRTNPGWQNPEIDHALGTPDELATLLIFNREDKPEIAITHFQTHPDVIGGNKVSADWCGFVRRTYERMIPNSRCIFFTGAQGDTNHVDVRLTKEEGRGYPRAKYMGEKIAMSLIANIPLAKPMKNTHLAYRQKNIVAYANKGKPEELEEAIRIDKIYKETHDKDQAVAAANLDVKSMHATTVVAKACRIVELMDAPDSRELYLTAIAIGDAVFAGIPGEPFTDIGRAIKDQSSYAVTLPTCNTNGKEGYYPTDFTEGSYEAATSRFKADTAKRIIDGFNELIESFK
ncbi:MAG: hypothetical protein IKM48_08390 [Clostridia bacterium]|nr:hypothetical protein [Clostridia bacterium]